MGFFDFLKKKDDEAEEPAADPAQDAPAVDPAQDDQGPAQDDQAPAAPAPEEENQPPAVDMD